MTGSATQLATGLNATCPFPWYFLLNPATLVDMYINTLDYFFVKKRYTININVNIMIAFPTPGENYNMNACTQSHIRCIDWKKLCFTSAKLHISSVDPLAFNNK